MDDRSGLGLLSGETYAFCVDVERYPSASLHYTNGGPTVFSNADLALLLLTLTGTGFLVLRRRTPA